MWSRRGAVALASAVAVTVVLAGCGFAPVYGAGGDGLRGAVRAEAPDTDETFAFVRRFEERLGRPEAPRYDLAYTLSTTQDALAIDRSDNVTRLTIEGQLAWRLVPQGGGAAVLSGNEIAFTSYSAPDSTIATFASRRDADRRLAIILADKVVTRLLGSASALAR